ncbi:MAG: TIR domain-containing protein [Planctomycetota bacterium]|nr:TIR domain-containing protein [Planctomycetota bacterium]
MADIFICYSRKDTQEVSRWVRRLEAEGFSVWMDLDSVDGASLWAKEIVQAIDDCSVLILMLSRHSVESHHVVKEVSLASEKEKRILPLKIEPVDIPPSMQYQLANIHFLELFRGDEEKIYSIVVRALSRHGVAAGAGPEAADSAAEPAVAPAPSQAKSIWPRLKHGLLALREGCSSALYRFWMRARPRLKQLWARLRPVLLEGPHKLWKRLALGVLAGLVLLAGLWAVWPSADVPPVSANEAPVLDNATLRLATQAINVRRVKKGFLQSDEKTLIGSAGVFRSAGGKLFLVTSSGWLDLKGLGKSPEIEAYEIWVTFVSGESRVVSRFSDKVGNLDLAVLEVDGRGLKPGKHYVVLPFRPDLELSQGDEVVMVKSSPRLNSTSNIQTFGRIQAVRDLTAGWKTCRAIQSDAAVTEANRGGLLFKEDDGEFLWIGVHVFEPGAEYDQNVSVYAGDFLGVEPRWYPCDPGGAAQALREIYSANARVAK